jgi:hypothetical protein
MSFFKLKGRVQLLLTAFALVVGGLMSVGCGNDDDSSSGGGGGGGLACGSGEAWIDESGNFGFVFYSDGKMREVWKKDGGKWYFGYCGTWSANGNSLTITDCDGDVDNLTYSISGDKLTMSKGTKTLTFYKKSGVNPVEQN